MTEIFQICLADEKLSTTNLSQLCVTKLVLGIGY